MRTGRFAFWFYLAIILVVGAACRLHGITAYSFWYDEYWNLYLATGRGDAIRLLQAGTALAPPPVGFAGAPPWWHIWTGLNSVVHPPFYFFLVRVWVYLFGDSDAVVRSLSTVASLLGVVWFFQILRRRWGNAMALLAAGLMTFAIGSIDFSQQARPYTLMVMLGLAAADAMFRIESGGATWRRTIGLGLAILLLAFTHYFDLGLIGGLGVYAVIRLRGKDRRRAIAAIIVPVLLFAVLWTPMAIRQAAEINTARNIITTPPTSNQFYGTLLTIPQRILMGRSCTSSLITLFLVVIVFLLPIARRLQGDDLFWWLWILASIGPLAADDFLNIGGRPLLIAETRYIFIVLPALCALSARAMTPRPAHVRVMALLALLCLFPDAAWSMGNHHIVDRFLFELREIGWVRFTAVLALAIMVPIRRWSAWIPPALIACLVAVAATDRVRSGQDVDAGADPVRQWNVVADAIEQSLQPGDLLIFRYAGLMDDASIYVAVQHYAHDDRHYVVLLGQRLVKEPRTGPLPGFNHALIVTIGAEGLAAQMPGWTVESVSPRYGIDYLVRVSRDKKSGGS